MRMTGQGNPGKAQNEPMLSGLPPIATDARTSSIGSIVPKQPLHVPVRANYEPTHDASSSSKALAFSRSDVSRPSVNQA